MGLRGGEMQSNPLGLNGIEFIEFASPRPEELHRLFLEFGFSKVARHRWKALDLYTQNEIHLIINRETNSFGSAFTKLHGPSVCSMGWKVADPLTALEGALARGARACDRGDLSIAGGTQVPAVFGIGDSLIYFVSDRPEPDKFRKLGFDKLERPEMVADKGFQFIDHLTNNVPLGTMGKWAGFYKDIFGFTEVRYFDIRGIQTGLQSYALRSPCGTFCIPINEAKEENSQINEYLREYNGPGIQHIAFSSTDILKSLDLLSGTGIETLDIDDEYYASVFDRVPNVTEDHAEIKRKKVLVDGDEEGYLLQIFTRNVIGPIFIEIIQRKNHLSFGEGYFGALFRSIEKDQIRRGVLVKNVG